MGRCEDCRCYNCECISPEAARELKRRHTEIVERARELDQRMHDGECDTDDLIAFVEEVAKEPL